MERRAGRKRSDRVRQALGQFQGTRPIDLVRDLLGAVESGLPDLGQRRREHLLSKLRP